MDPENGGTFHSRAWNRIKNNRILAIIMIVGVATIAVAQFSDSVGRLTSPDSAAVAEYCELLLPLTVQLDRTAAAFGRWHERNLSLESEIIREGNIEARNILMSKAHRIPASLEMDGRRLIEHYDRWLEEYDRLRIRTPESNEAFVFVGPAGFPFPTDAESRFRARAAELRRLLGNNIECP